MPAPDGKRRLPLAPRSETNDPADDDRPPWHWAAIGTVGAFVFWLPLAIVANLAAGGRSGALPALLHAAALVVACAGAGLVVGRFGGRAGRREAAVAGLVTPVIAGLVVASRGLGAGLAAIATWALVVALLGAIGALAGWAGGAMGVRRRPR